MYKFKEKFYWVNYPVLDLKNQSEIDKLEAIINKLKKLGYKVKKIIGCINLQEIISYKFIQYW
ncbi:hypothetical protein RRG54_00975 [Mycoplasmopsis felis]|uniref:hypothetical protein n=1 Tax=Mycoplasmopsis felis TaxID=33923 RepID=UPI00300C776D